jgi:flagellar basal-body rod protein FlgB
MTEMAMTNPLDNLLHFQGEALKLRGYRQELLAANIANADTPNYKAVDFDFAKALRAAAQGTGQSGAAAPGGAATGGKPQVQYRIPAPASLDGNSVEIDAARAQFAGNTVRYEAAMNTLSMQIKMMLSAIKG